MDSCSTLFYQVLRVSVAAAATLGVNFPNGMKVDYEGDPSQNLMVNNIVNDGGTQGHVLF